VWLQDLYSRQLDQWFTVQNLEVLFLFWLLTKSRCILGRVGHLSEDGLWITRVPHIVGKVRRDDQLVTCALLEAFYTPMVNHGFYHVQSLASMKIKISQSVTVLKPIKSYHYLSEGRATRS